MIQMQCPYCDSTNLELIEEQNEEEFLESRFKECLYECCDCNKRFWVQKNYAIKLTCASFYDEDYTAIKEIKESP